MVLQAYIDDSGSDPQDEEFALAGLVAPLEAWEAFGFASRWQQICDEPRAIQYYKTNHAIGLKKQFDGFSEPERDKKLLALSKLIAEFGSEPLIHDKMRFRPRRIGAVLRRSEYTSIFESTFTDKRIFYQDRVADPYGVLALYICGLCEAFVQRHPQFTKVDLFFDHQGKIGKKLKRYYDRILRHQFPALGECSQVDDQTFKPLQAADYDRLACQTRLSVGKHVDQCRYILEHAEWNSAAIEHCLAARGCYGF
jgi:hypothetical protein